MRLADCEPTHRHIRGHNVAFIFGPRGISDAEARELAAEWGHTFGPVRLPAYVSPDGWRTLYPVDGAGPIASLLRVDEDRAVIEFDGVKFSAELLRTFATPTPDGIAFRILEVDGIATIGRIDLPTHDQAEQLSKADTAAAPTVATAAPSPAPAPAASAPAEKPASTVAAAKPATKRASGAKKKVEA